MKSGHYLVIEPDGSKRWEYIEHSTWQDQLHDIIGCDCVEQVHTIKHGLIMIIDESGRIKKPPKEHNHLASCFYLGFLWKRCSPYNIVGTVVFADLVPSGEFDREQTWGPCGAESLEWIAEITRGIPPCPKEG